MTKANEILSLFKEVDPSGIRNLLIGLKVDRNAADKYADFIMTDVKKFTSDKLKSRVRSRMNDLFDDDKQAQKATNMIMDEL